MIVLFILSVNTLLAYLVGKQGEKKEIGLLNAALLSFFFSPIIGMLFVINSPIKTTTKEEKIKQVKEVRKQLTEEEIIYQKKIIKKDINNRIKFTIVFIIILGIIYFVK